eukprot:474537_1
MGHCCSARSNQSILEEQLNATVDRELVFSIKAGTRTKKVVLLGAGNSGKSTFFKQLKTIHGTGFTDTDRLAFKKHITHQIIQDMKRMIYFAEEMLEEDPQQYAHFKLSDDTIEPRNHLKNAHDDTFLTDKIIKYIEILWADQGIRYLWNERDQFSFTESTGYFLDNIETVSSEKYVPTYEDVLLCRHRTIGIVDKLFTINGTGLRIFDVGGQMSERRKWIHCFEDVDAVIYVASLTGYAESMYEMAGTENVMQDSLSLFGRTCNNSWFEDTLMILFLNKSDLFVEKIKTVSLACCFPDYQGKDTYDGALREIKKQFKARNHQKDRQVYIHITCAVDDKNVTSVFNDVQHLLVTTKLDTEGLC